MLFFLVVSIFTFNIQPIKADQTIIDLETFEDGTVEWTDEVSHSGSYSVKLLIPEGASVGSWAFVKVPYGDYLSTLQKFSFYVKYVGARPRFAIYLDKDKDGDVDSLLLSDYLDFGSGEWTVGTGGLRWGWTEASYPPWRYGDVWQCYDYWQDMYDDALALYVGVALQYWAVEPEGLGEPLYVDDVTINGITYDLEPASIPPTPPMDIPELGVSLPLATSIITTLYIIIKQRFRDRNP